MLQFLSLNRRWLGAGALLAFGSCFGQTFFISLFAADIQAAFDLSFGEWGRIYAIGTLSSAIVMVWAGVLTDHFTARILGVFVMLGLAAACLLMAFNPWVALLPVIIFLLRFLGQGMASHIAVVAMSRWFAANRGKALSVATLGFAVGEAFLPMAVVAAMALIGFSAIWIIAAIISLALIPILQKLLSAERNPKTVAVENQATGMGDRFWTRSDVLRHWLFWLMIPALLGPSAFNTAFFFFQQHFAEVKGWDHIHLVALFPIYTGVGIGAMVLSGILLDRYGVARLLPVYQLPMVLAFGCFSLFGSGAGIFLGFCFLGLTSGANSTLPNAFWAEFYGTKHLGAIKSAAAAIMVLGSAVGPGLIGYFLDQGFTFTVLYLCVSVFFLGATACMGIGIYRAKSQLLST